MLKNNPHIERKEKTVFLSKARVYGQFLLMVLAGPLFTLGQIDPMEYPPGHPTPTVSYIQQIQGFPVPRFKPGHTLLPNYNVIDPIYAGSYKQPGISDATAIANSVTIQTELAKNFNYMINVTWSTSPYNDACVNLANAYPQYKVALMTLRAQTNGTKMWYQGFANDHYLQNSSGQFLGWSGAVTSGNKTWRPTTPASDYSSDGTTVRNWLNSSLANLTRPVDLVNEDGEVYPIIETQGLQADPGVTAAKNASGLGWQPYLAKSIAANDNLYRAQFMSHPRLANAKYTEYRLDGHPTVQLDWSQSRFINTPINGQYYSTTDLYVRWPSNWQNWTSAWHGLKWITQSRYFELSVGDKIFSPFVAAGWDQNPEVDVRPAQWLGLMKIMGMYGAEFYYTCYFNEAPSYNPPNPPPFNPAGYAWQSVIPPYSQALTSRYEDLLRSGSLMAGDMIDYSNPILPSPFYQFSTGASNKVVIIRKSNTVNKYAITGAIENSSNVIGSTPLIDDAQITLNSQTLKFKIRRQGSTYIYDNTNTSAPVFYQLDGWHESSHPWYWSKDFNLEAEVYDNTNATYNLKTTVPAGTPSGDYRNFTTFITFPDAQTTFTPIEYVFSPRTAGTTYYLWVKMRSRVTGVTTGCSVSVDNANTKTISCANDTVWKWYKIDATSQQAVSFGGLSVGNHTLRITPTNSKLEIDQVVLSVNSNLNLTPAGPVCSTNCTATATAGSPLAFCPGGSVTLTASSGASYLWTPGNQTTQSITVSSAGSYSVKVTQSNGCSATSTPLTVSVSSAATASISASGPLTFFQGGSVTLTANSASSYLWSPGNQTSQSIVVTTAGTYNVRVTNASGCSATSSSLTVVVLTGQQGVANITASGPTTFCQGGQVTLTANTGISYLWSNGSTAQSIWVNTSGSYVVTVTFSANTSTSVPKVVSVIPCSCPVATGLTQMYVTAADAKLHWNALSGVDSLQIRVYDSTAHAYFYTPVFKGTAINKKVSVLPSRTYRWRIRSKCGNTWSLYSSRQSFRTPVLRVAGPGDNEPAMEMYEGTAEDRLDEDVNVAAAAEMNIFPNPASVSATVLYSSDHAGNITLQIVNFTGKMMQVETLNLEEGENLFELDLRNLPKGMYMVMINDNGMGNNRKIVIN